MTCDSGFYDRIVVIFHDNSVVDNWLGGEMPGPRFEVTRNALLPLMLAGALVVLWIDSVFAVRELAFIPAGDAAHGFRSARGWLQWVSFTTWDEVIPFTPHVSVPYLALVFACLALALRGMIRGKRAAASP